MALHIRKLRGKLALVRLWGQRDEALNVSSAMDDPPVPTLRRLHIASRESGRDW